MYQLFRTRMVERGVVQYRYCRVQVVHTVRVQYQGYNRMLLSVLSVSAFIVLRTVIPFAVYDGSIQKVDLLYVWPLYEYVPVSVLSTSTRTRTVSLQLRLPVRTVRVLVAIVHTVIS